MKAGKVSVIVPIYNVESEITSCIMSILEQDYPNIELVLVNDGSTDKSGEICQQLATEYPQIRYFEHENRGVSYTRNKGIELASGEWLCFVDSDDHILPKYVSAMVEDVNTGKNIDIVIHGINIIETGGGVDKLLLPKSNLVACSLKGDSRFFDNIPVLCLASPISKIFRKTIIDEQNVRFNEKLDIGEDYIFTLEYLLSVRNYISRPVSNYNYVRSPGSLSTTYNSFEDEVFAEETLFSSTHKFAKLLNLDVAFVNAFYEWEFRKHAYRILFSLYKNKVTKYSKSERIFKVRSLPDSQFFRLSRMIESNSKNGKFLGFMLNRKVFGFSEWIVKLLVKVKIS